MRIAISPTNLIFGLLVFCFALSYGLVNPGGSTPIGVVYFIGALILLNLVPTGEGLRGYMHVWIPLVGAMLLLAAGTFMRTGQPNELVLALVATVVLTGVLLVSEAIAGWRERRKAMKS